MFSKTGWLHWSVVVSPVRTPATHTHCKALSPCTSTGVSTDASSRLPLLNPFAARTSPLLAPFCPLHWPTHYVYHLCAMLLQHPPIFQMLFMCIAFRNDTSPTCHGLFQTSLAWMVLLSANPVSSPSHWVLHHTVCLLIGCPYLSLYTWQY